MQCYAFSTLHYISLQETRTTSYAIGNKCTIINERGIIEKNDKKCYI